MNILSRKSKIRNIWEVQHVNINEHRKVKSQKTKFKQ